MMTLSADDLRAIAIGLVQSLAASAVLAALCYGLFRGRRRAAVVLRLQVQRWRATNAGRGLLGSSAAALGQVLRGLLTGLVWLLVLLLGELWFSFVLGRFDATRPWSERSSQWLLDVATQFAQGIAGAVPGLVTAVLIFLLARLVVQASSAVMDSVARGNLVLGGIDADTAGPTRRVVTVVIWLFALALAYPFLPGASSDAFKGVSVLAGLMLSMGASGVVGQVVSGLSLMYARILRPGEYVRIGSTEGTVHEVGLFATKLHTGLGEEVSLPNAVVLGQAVHNFSRLVDDGHFMLHASVTIGYATPWRQVHAMLLEAAGRTPGVAAAPPPYVVQAALSDFYVEYRLCAQADRGAPRRRAEAISALHGHIQDVFNENGVQIMSPHYRADPAQPQVVPPGQWAPGLAPRAAVAPTSAPVQRPPG